MYELDDWKSPSKGTPEKSAFTVNFKEMDPDTVNKPIVERRAVRNSARAGERTLHHARLSTAVTRNRLGNGKGKATPVSSAPSTAGTAGHLDSMHVPIPLPKKRLAGPDQKRLPNEEWTPASPTGEEIPMERGELDISLPPSERSTPPPKDDGTIDIFERAGDVKPFRWEYDGETEFPGVPALVAQSSAPNLFATPSATPASRGLSGPHYNSFHKRKPTPLGRAKSPPSSAKKLPPRLGPYAYASLPSEQSSGSLPGTAPARVSTASMGTKKYDSWAFAKTPATPVDNQAFAKIPDSNSMVKVVYSGVGGEITIPMSAEPSKKRLQPIKRAMTPSGDPSITRCYETEYMMQWAKTFGVEKHEWASIILLAEAKLHEVRERTMHLGAPNPVRTHVALELLHMMTGRLKEAGPLIETLLSEVLLAVYKEPPEVDAWPYLHGGDLADLWSDRAGYARQLLPYHEEIETLKRQYAELQGENQKLQTENFKGKGRDLMGKIKQSIGDSQHFTRLALRSWRSLAARAKQVRKSVMMKHMHVMMDSTRRFFATWKHEVQLSRGDARSEKCRVFLRRIIARTQYGLLELWFQRWAHHAAAQRLAAKSERLESLQRSLAQVNRKLDAFGAELLSRGLDDSEIHSIMESLGLKEGKSRPRPSVFGLGSVRSATTMRNVKDSDSALAVTADDDDDDAEQGASLRSSAAGLTVDPPSPRATSDPDEESPEIVTCPHCKGSFGAGAKRRSRKASPSRRSQDSDRRKGSKGVNWSEERVEAEDEVLLEGGEEEWDGGLGPSRLGAALAQNMKNLAGSPPSKKGQAKKGHSKSLGAVQLHGDSSGWEGESEGEGEVSGDKLMRRGRMMSEAGLGDGGSDVDSEAPDPSTPQGRLRSSSLERSQPSSPALTRSKSNKEKRNNKLSVFSRSESMSGKKSPPTGRRASKGMKGGSEGAELRASGESSASTTASGPRGSISDMARGRKSKGKAGSPRGDDFMEGPELTAEEVAEQEKREEEARRRKLTVNGVVLEQFIALDSDKLGELKLGAGLAALERLDRIILNKGENLMQVFHYYASVGRVPMMNYWHFLRDTRMLDHQWLDAWSAEKIFNRASRAKGTVGELLASTFQVMDEEQAAKLCQSGRDFVLEPGLFTELLIRLGSAKFPDLPPLDGLNSLYDQYLAPLSCQVAAEEFREALSTEDMRQVCTAHQNTLALVFVAYSRRFPGTGLPERPKGDRTRAKTPPVKEAGPAKASMVTLRKEGWMTLMQECHLLGGGTHQIREEQLNGIVSEVLIHEQIPELHLEGFIESIVTIALYINPFPYTPLHKRVDDFLSTKFLPELLGHVRALKFLV